METALRIADIREEVMRHSMADIELQYSKVMNRRYVMTATTLINTTDICRKHVLVINH